MHCGANTYQASSEKRRLRATSLCAITGEGASWSTPSPAADIEYTVPSAPTATSRAASPGTSAIEILPVEADRREHVLAAPEP